MNDGEQKSRLHIHMGGLILVGVIALIIFKVDIKSKIQSPQFQKNLTYIEEQVKNIWQKYVLDPVKTKVGVLFIDFTNTEMKKIQDNVTKNLLDTTNMQN